MYNAFMTTFQYVPSTTSEESKQILLQYIISYIHINGKTIASVVANHTFQLL